MANASPIIARNLLHQKYRQPIDNGLKFIDGEDLLGTSKTWRGIIASIIITSAIALLLGYSISTGSHIALLAMMGDLISSFIKRRCKLAASSQAPLLDQIPESFLPGIFMLHLFNLNISQLLLLILFFVIFELGVSRILYQWGIRKHPY